MAKLTVVGLDMYLNNLRNMNNELRNINKGALGEGAKVAAETIRDALDTLPIRPEDAKHDRAYYGVTESEFAQITNNFGIARFKNASGGWNTSVGFHGMVHTEGQEVPTGMLMQAVEHGTKFRRPTRIISRAVNSVKTTVPAAMQEYIDEKVNKIMN